MPMPFCLAELRSAPWSARLLFQRHCSRWFALLLLVGATTVHGDELLVLTTDFSTGSLSSVELDSPWNVELDVAPTCPDAVARSYGGLLYVVNRFGCDNIQVIDPAQNYQTIREFSVGAGSNPQDIALASSTRAFVSRYDRPTLLAVNPSTGAILDSLSLAQFADSDGLPEMHRLHLSGRYLYVQLQRLDRNNEYEPVAPSYLVVVDTQSWTIVDTDANTPGVNPIRLTGLNPSGPMEIDLVSGHLLVPDSGRFLVLDGGIERVDLARWQSEGFVVTESTLGGDLLHYTQGSGERAFAIVSDASFSTCLVAYHPVHGTNLGTIYCTDGFELADCETSQEGWLYLADRTFIDPGVRVFDPLTGQPQSGLIPTGLPPFELIVHRPATSEVSFPDTDPMLSRRPSPNPATNRLSCRLSPAVGAEGGTVVQVVDALGRVVRSLAPSIHGQVEWDLSDHSGRSVPSGLYWIRIRTALGREEAHRVVVTR